MGLRSILRKRRLATFQAQAAESGAPPAGSGHRFRLVRHAAKKARQFEVRKLNRSIAEELEDGPGKKSLPSVRGKAAQADAVGLLQRRLAAVKASVIATAVVFSLHPQAVSLDDLASDALSSIDVTGATTAPETANAEEAWAWARLRAAACVRKVLLELSGASEVETHKTRRRRDGRAAGAGAVEAECRDDADEPVVIRPRRVGGDAGPAADDESSFWADAPEESLADHLGCVDTDSILAKLTARAGRPRSRRAAAAVDDSDDEEGDAAGALPWEGMDREDGDDDDDDAGDDAAVGLRQRMPKTAVEAARGEQKMGMGRSGRPTAVHTGGQDQTPALSVVAPGKAKKPPPQKKRMGQRARRLLAEKTHGAAARHLAQAAAADEPAARDVVGTRRAASDAAPHKAAVAGAAARGAAAAAPTGEGAVHPSWAAKQAQKQALAIAPAGKRIKFAD